jgi:hypothetical protein
MVTEESVLAGDFAASPAGRLVEAATTDGRTDAPLLSVSAGIDSRSISTSATVDGDDGSRAVSNMAAAITQNTRRNAPAPIIRIESGDVLAGGAAVAVSGFFGRSAVFARVGFFGGIKSSFTKVPDLPGFEQRGCRFLRRLRAAKHVCRQELDAATGGPPAACHLGHTHSVIGTPMLRGDRNLLWLVSGAEGGCDRPDRCAAVNDRRAAITSR